MSLLQGCQNIVNKYNLDDTDKKFILDLHKECYDNFCESCINQDRLQEYFNVINYIIEYINDSNITELKNNLKEIFKPYGGYSECLYIPENLYTDEEIIEFENEWKRRKNMNKLFSCSDVPNEPISSDESEEEMDEDIDLIIHQANNIIINNEEYVNPETGETNPNLIYD